VESEETNRRIASLRADLASGQHLHFENEIVPYIDERLDTDDKRAVEAHLANCEVCRREVDELRELAKPRRHVRNALIAALAAAAAIAIGVTVLMQRPIPVQPTRTVVRVEPLAISLRDGDRTIGVDRSGAFHGIAIDANIAQRAATLLAHPDLGTPATIASLAGAPRMLRGETAAANAIEVVSPVRIAVVETRPELRWHGPSNRSYQITITDDSMELHGETKSDHWTPSADLARGRTYTWQVAAVIDGRRVVAPAPPDPPALFRVVDQATADAIKSANSHLVGGMLAYEAGALREAAREFLLLAAENPGSPIPAKLVASCERAMGAKPSR